MALLLLDSLSFTVCKFTFIAYCLLWVPQVSNSCVCINLSLKVNHSYSMSLLHMQLTVCTVQYSVPRNNDTLPAFWVQYLCKFAITASESPPMRSLATKDPYLVVQFEDTNLSAIDLKGLIILTNIIQLGRLIRSERA